jgi:HK97 gp10 family phage protein
MIKMKLDGAEKISEILRELPRRVSRKVLLDALKLAAEPIRADASAMAPVEPGAPDLAANIGIMAERSSGEPTIGVGPSKSFFYGGFQELGTRHHAAQPFLRPAFERNVEQAVKTVGFGIWHALISKGFTSTRGGGGGGSV